MHSLVCSSVCAEDDVADARICIWWVGTQSGSTDAASAVVAGTDFAGLPGSKVAAVQAEAMHGGLQGKSGSPHPQEVGAFACQVSSRPDFVPVVIFSLPFCKDLRNVCTAMRKAWKRLASISLKSALMIQPVLYREKCGCPSDVLADLRMRTLQNSQPQQSSAFA